MLTETDAAPCRQQVAGVGVVSACGCRPRSSAAASRGAGPLHWCCPCGSDGNAPAPVWLHWTRPQPHAGACTGRSPSALPSSNMRHVGCCCCWAAGRIMRMTCLLCSIRCNQNCRLDCSAPYAVALGGASSVRHALCMHVLVLLLAPPAQRGCQAAQEGNGACRSACSRRSRNSVFCVMCMVFFWGAGMPRWQAARQRGVGCRHVLPHRAACAGPPAACVH